MRKKIFLSALIIGSSLLAAGQVTFQKGYFLQSFIYAVEQTSDSGFIATSYLQSGNFSYASLIKTNSSGDTLWTKYFGEPDNQLAVYVQQTRDKGYIITSNRYINSIGDACLIRTDSMGDTLWTKAYGGNGDDFIHMAKETFDGGFILIGFTESFGVSKQVYLIKTDANGDTIWTKKYGGTFNQFSGSILQLPDSGFAFATSTNTGIFCLIRTDNLGDTLWTKSYDSGIEGWEMKRTNDNGFIFFSLGVTLAKTDSLGNVQWVKRYHPTAPNVLGRDIDLTSDGGFVITGFESDSIGQYGFILKTDSLGDTQWCKNYRTMPSLFSISQAFDKGYICSGVSGGPWFGGLLKTDSTGYSECNEEHGNFIFNSLSPQITFTPITVSSTATIVRNPNIKVLSGCITNTFCSSVSLPEINNPQSEVELSPNPTNHFVKISSEFRIKVIEVYNLTGEKIITANANGRNDFSIDISRLNPGLYFLKAETEIGTVMKKFIKQ